MFNNNKKEDKLVNSTNGQSPSLNMISEGSKVKGNIQSQNDIRISGKIEGEASSKGKLIITSSGVIDGNVKAAEADISGNLIGEIHITNRLTLRKTAKINGNIYTKTLIVEEGAEINGDCKMGTETPSSNGQTTESKKQTVKVKD
jgi:cytoskeletal protein CcmA (bactofilin family)